MVDFSLNLCYGIVISEDKMEEIEEKLTDEQSDELNDNYARCINIWTGGDYFIGVSTFLDSNESSYVYPISSLSNPFNENNEELVNFKKFFTVNNLWSLIDWKPELLLINFCF